MKDDSRVYLLLVSLFLLLVLADLVCLQSDNSTCRARGGELARTLWGTACVQRLP